MATKAEQIRNLVKAFGGNPRNSTIEDAIEDLVAVAGEHVIFVTEANQDCKNISDVEVSVSSNIATAIKKLSNGSTISAELVNTWSYGNANITNRYKLTNIAYYAYDDDAENSVIFYFTFTGYQNTLMSVEIHCSSDGTITDSYCIK